MSIRVRDRNRRMLEWSEENAESLLKLRPSQQNEALRRVYLDGKRAGSQYLSQQEAIRSEISRKSAKTRNVNRRVKIKERIESAFDRDSQFSKKEFSKNFLKAENSDLRELERLHDSDMRNWIAHIAERDARAKRVSYAFYHGAK